MATNRRICTHYTNMEHESLRITEGKAREPTFRAFDFAGIAFALRKGELSDTEHLANVDTDTSTSLCSGSLYCTSMPS